MTATFTTDNIDNLQAIALAVPLGWQVTFRSTNDGMHHQLYVNGKLADMTDSVAQRCFFLDSEAFDREIVIAAVDAASRTVDMSTELSPQFPQQSWIYKRSVLRAAELGSGGQVEVLGDHATGQIDPVPLAIRQLTPEWSSQWGFGKDSFGSGGLGYDAGGAVGLGKGAFGAGLFGVDTELASISAPLPEEGTHQVMLRVVAATGQYADGQVAYQSASPPPDPPAGLVATSYDNQTKELTLQIQ